MPLPTQLPVLNIAFAELKGDLRSGELRAEIKRVRGIDALTQHGKERKRVRGDLVSIAVVEMNAGLAHFDPPVWSRISCCSSAISSGVLGNGRRS